MLTFVGIDDTDTPDSHGTGRLARQVAAALAAHFNILGVIRHQLLNDPRVPSTRRNSSAAIILDTDSGAGLVALLEWVPGLVLESCRPGSDPGLCIAQSVPAAVIDFGQRAKHQLLSQTEARTLAVAHGILLLGLAGDEGGVIGALAAVGLAASGEDGRYVLVGRSRELSGLQPISALLENGIQVVRAADGQAVDEGLVQADKLRPARRGGQPVLFVEQNGNIWQPLQID